MKLDFQHATKKIVRQDIINNILEKQVIIFGAGESGSWAKELLEKNEICVCAFCDNSKEKQKQLKHGLPVLSLENAVEQYPDAVICLASMYWHEIKDQIKKINPVMSERTYNILSSMNWETLSRLYISCEEEYIREHILEFEEMYMTLADERSRSTFENLLNYRLTRFDHYIENIKSNDKTYLDYSILDSQSIAQICDGIIIDGGAFDGDTVKFFVEELGNKCKRLEIHAYEISTANCDKIRSLQVENHITIKAYNNALWKQSDQFLSWNGEELSGRVDVDNKNCENVTKTKCLDDYGNQRISFIKLDVEGAEREVLTGAKNIIERYHPFMAISAYHLQDDFLYLYDILKQYQNHYKFYLRHYLYSSGETVLYAVPV